MWNAGIDTYETLSHVKGSERREDECEDENIEACNRVEQSTVESSSSTITINDTNLFFQPFQK